MNITVTATNVSIEDEELNQGEYNVRQCNFILSEEYEGLICKALFTVAITKLTYEQPIINGRCTIPYETTEQKGKVIVGVIGYELEDDELKIRYSPNPDEFYVTDGSYIEDIENQSTPTPSELEQLEARVSQVEIDAAQVEINTQDISDIKQEQTTQNGDILLRALITETGAQIALSIDSSNFKMTATLKDKNGNVIYTSNEIDLPIESMVISATYDNVNKQIVLTLQNGQTINVPVGDLVSGLVSNTDYATNSVGGVIKSSVTYGTAVDTSTGVLMAVNRTYSNYQSANNQTFISKGALENVITGKGIVDNTKIKTVEDTTAGNVYDVTYINTMIGNLESILETLDVGGGVQ